MRKKRLLLLLLAAVLLLALVLRGCGGKKRAEAEKTKDEATEQTLAKHGDGTTVELGTVSGSTDGGVTITLADGQKRVIFTDVAVDSWYVKAVNYVISAGLMSGSEAEQKFRPEYGMTRVEFASALYNFAGGAQENAKNVFSDVTSADWFSNQVAWITNHGYMNGKGDSTFEPQGFLSCQDALIILYRYAGEPEAKGTLEDYPYAPKVASYGVDAVTWAWNSGLITETECVWYPTQTISRAQAALLLMRYSELSAQQ